MSENSEFDLNLNPKHVLGQLPVASSGADFHSTVKLRVTLQTLPIASAPATFTDNVLKQTSAQLAPNHPAISNHSPFSMSRRAMYGIAAGLVAFIGSGIFIQNNNFTSATKVLPVPTEVHAPISPKVSPSLSPKYTPTQSKSPTSLVDKQRSSTENIKVTSSTLPSNEIKLIKPLPTDHSTTSKAQNPLEKRRSRTASKLLKKSVSSHSDEKSGGTIPSHLKNEEE